MKKRNFCLAPSYCLKLKHFSLPPHRGLGIRLRQHSPLSGKFQSASHGIAPIDYLSVWVVESAFLEGVRFFIPVVVPAVPLGFRVDHEVLEAVVKESSPSSVHPQSPRVIDALPERDSDRSRLRFVIGAVLVCLKRGAELGDGVGIR